MCGKGDRSWQYQGYIMRPAKAEDANPYYDQNYCPLDKEIIRMTGSREYYTKEEVVEFFQNAVRDPLYFFFLIFSKDGQIVGESVINEVDKETKSGNFRIAIFREEARGKGLGSWAVKQTRDFAFQELKLHRLSLEVYSFNKRAEHVYREAGFQIEGILRDAVTDGKDYGNVILMSILEGEWKRKKREQRGNRLKVAVIGHSGCGKSTLASWIAKQQGIPLLHLDQVHWLPGWVERPKEEERQMVREFLDSHDSWVIDGNYHSMEYERRMKEADRILFLDFPRLVCLYRAWKRARRYRGRTRDSMTEGCTEKLDLEFILWILYQGRSRKARKEYRRVMKRYGHKTVRICNQRELDKERQKWRTH